VPDVLDTRHYSAQENDFREQSALLLTDLTSSSRTITFILSILTLSNL